MVRISQSMIRSDEARRQTKLKDSENWLKLILGNLVEKHIYENFLLLFCLRLTKRQAKEEKKEICVHEPSPN